jgi:hypothetical protein
MAQPHHFYAAQALCENIDAAPAPSENFDAAPAAIEYIPGQLF